jgi:predicted anti-sigma-YlaC factor YlaD
MSEILSETLSENIGCCRSEEIAAYLDGELDTQAVALFDAHLKACRECAQELNEQRRLLCALDYAFGEGDSPLSLPKNFAQVVATHAESDMSGVRLRAEHVRALRWCAVLSLVTFALLGASFRSSTLVPFKAAARFAASLSGLAWNALYDAGAGLAVILRALGRRFIFESNSFSLAASLLFVIALALLPRLIVRYHRTHDWRGTRSF